METIDKRLAPFWRRILSFIADVAIWTTSYLVFCIPFKQHSMYKGQEDNILILFWIVFIMYQSLMIAKNKGRTLGGLWFATKIVGVKKIEVSFWQALFRSFILWCMAQAIYRTEPIHIGLIVFLIIMLSPLMAPFKTLHQSIWDYFSKTYVIGISVEEENKKQVV